MFSKLAFTAALVALFTSTSGHMLITQPSPYGADSLNNSPLDKSGSDYPCKQRPNVYAPPEKGNNMPVGAPQTLKFKGSAVHGGGSCQLSLTTDKAPTKDSQFKVIHSIIGGCPANTTGGNLASNPNGGGANTYTYSIPDDVPNGDYTFAWTWFNKIGNREMYMNCAPVTVTGSKGSPDTFNKLPNMFIANVGGGTATVTDSTNAVFPNPGNSVETDEAGPSNVPPQCPPDSNGCTKPPSGGATTAQGGSSGSSGAGPYAGSAAPAPAPAPVASSPGAMGPGAQTGSGSQAQAPASPAAASPASGPATPGVAPPAGSVPCNNPGQVVCVGASQFAICNIDGTGVPQPLAQGTHCAGGVISKRNLGGFSLKARQEHGHAHSHAHSHAH